MQTTLITKHNHKVVLEPHNAHINGVALSIDISLDGINHRNAAAVVHSGASNYSWSIREIKGLCHRHSTIGNSKAESPQQCFNQIVEYVRNAS